MGMLISPAVPLLDNVDHADNSFQVGHRVPVRPERVDFLLGHGHDSQVLAELGHRTAPEADRQASWGERYGRAFRRRRGVDLIATTEAVRDWQVAVRSRLGADGHTQFLSA